MTQRLVLTLSACCTVTVAAPGALADAGDPFTTESPLPIGVLDAQKVFVAIDQKAVGTATTFEPVAYAAPKWKRGGGLRLRPYTVDTKDPQTEAKSRERAEKPRLANDAAFDKAGVVEALPIRGGFTGRYRVPELGLVVYMEDDRILARTGDVSVMDTMTVVPSVSALTRRCKGARRNQIVHVVARPEWKAVAVYLESLCEPADAEAAGMRVRKLFVADVSTIL